MTLDRQRDAAHHRRGELDDEARDRLEVDLRALELLGDVAAVGERVGVAWEEHGHLAPGACETHDLLGRFERADVRLRGSHVEKGSAATIPAANDFGILDRLKRVYDSTA